MNKMRLDDRKPPKCYILHGLYYTYAEMLDDVSHANELLDKYFNGDVTSVYDELRRKYIPTIRPEMWLYLNSILRPITDCEYVIIMNSAKDLPYYSLIIDTLEYFNVNLLYEEVLG